MPGVVAKRFRISRVTPHNHVNKFLPMTGGQYFGRRTDETTAADAGASMTTFFFGFPEASPSLLRFLSPNSAIIMRDRCQCWQCNSRAKVALSGQSRPRSSGMPAKKIWDPTSKERHKKSWPVNYPGAVKGTGHAPPNGGLDGLPAALNPYSRCSCTQLPSPTSL